MAALPDLGRMLAASIETRKLPGAALAVLHEGEVAEVAAGVLNARTGVEATPDSLFQIGSITKVYTATLVLQLVDSGEVELDAPVRRYLPSFRVADPAATESITIRHLLTHSSGFDGGDHFFDGGRGDDALARYVESLAGLQQLTPPGRFWSYNNAGFTVLGRVVEAVTGQRWDDALRDRLLRPAGLDHSVTLPEDALLFRTAAGHRLGDDGMPALVPQWGLPRSAGPAGLICASAADVVGFARLHLEDGCGVLSPASVKAMQQEQIVLPTGDTSCGLGWILHDAGGTRTIWHTGGTLGQLAFLTAVPERGIAIALLTNGPTGGAVWQDVSDELAVALALPTPRATPASPPDDAPDLDLTRYTGRYERRTVHTTVTAEDDRLVATMEYGELDFELPPPPPMTLVPVDESTFVTLGPDGKPAMSVKFLDFDDAGRPQLLFAARLSRRVE